MEDFLNAVFNGWTGNNGEELTKPTMDFVVREHISVGNICSKSSLIGSTPQLILTHFLLQTNQPTITPALHAPTLPAVNPLSTASPPTEADQPNSPSASPPRNPPETPAKQPKTCSVPWSAPMFAGRKTTGWLS
jgi:hypothetical protein